MIEVDHIREGLALAGYPIMRVERNDGLIEAQFQLPGGSVTLALSPLRATAGEFAAMFDKAVGERAADDG